MKHQFLICLAILLTCLVACDQSESSKGANPKPYLTVLEEGLTEHGFDLFPQGQIEITSGLSSAMESGGGWSMRSRLQNEIYLKYFLQDAEKQGLLNLAEKQQRSPGQIAMGSRFFMVTATEKLRQMADPKKSDEKWLAVQRGTIKVLKIISEEPCKLQQATPGDKFLLVMGLISQTPTKVFSPKDGTVKRQELKFRAILQVNPFDKSYKFLTSDIGNPSEHDWFSNHVAKMIDG